MKQINGQWLIWILICAVTTSIVWLHPTQATSVDSRYYLQSAESLLAGRGYTVREEGRWVWNGTFPVGYPALTALTTFFSTKADTVLWGSKLVNILALLLFVIGWTNRIGVTRTTWLVSLWALGSFLKLVTYTWSETVFLVLLAEWVWQWQGLRQQPDFGRGCRLLGLGAALSLVRYVGGFVFALPLLAALIAPNYSGTINQKPGSERRNGLLVLAAGSVLFVAYAQLNYTMSGVYFGGERLLPTEPVSQIMRRFAVALLNELLMYDVTPGGSSALVWLGASLQAGLLAGFVYVARRGVARRGGLPEKLSSIDPLNRLFLWTGLTYLLVLFLARTVSPFSGPNPRLMAPFTFCVLMAGLNWIGQWPDDQQHRFRPFWAALILTSWLQFATFLTKKSPVSSGFPRQPDSFMGQVYSKKLLDAQDLTPV